MALRYQSPLSFDGVDSIAPIESPLCAKYMKSRAFNAVRNEYPQIVANIVDHLINKKNYVTRGEEEAEKDIRECFRSLTRLKNDVENNKPFAEITGDSSDVRDWNEYLSKEKESRDGCVNWFESPWTYTEGYFYRRIRAAFDSSKTLRSFDYFTPKKEEMFRNSLPDITRLSTAFRSMLLQWKDSEDHILSSLLRLAAWGNRMANGFRALSDEDLTYDKNPLGDNNSIFSPAQSETLLQDDSQAVYKFLADARPPGIIVDYVLDEVGLDLVVDLCLCDFLCATKLASKIRFHVKTVPWCVYGVTANDIKWTVSQMSGTESLMELESRWDRYLSSSVWSIHEDPFWTSPYTVGEMSDRDPGLYARLRSSGLIVFKGDTNYRKLLGGVNWNHWTSLEVATGGFTPTNMVLLRRLRSEMVAGLPTDKFTSLPFVEGGDSILSGGDYAMIQFHRQYRDVEAV